ncbi:MAG TPA: molecular chaperone HtpG [Streptosporangiaceae bacterium]|jgi:molecular chaperone HtpG
MTAQANEETFSFQAEVVEILDLMIHSLYSNKEIFLRELVSNASDAIDRLRIELLSQSEVPEAEGPLQIHVSYDAAARTVTVADNGIGMSREEVIQNIGTIAKSGTTEFLRSLTGDNRKDAALIGQFGVGFYSAFMVADRVVLTTRRSGLTAAAGVRWESDGKGQYALEAIERPQRGTTIVLHLRDDEDEFLNDYRLRSIIERYSDHISLPILMPAQKTADAPTEHEATEEPQVTVVNQGSALWTRSKSEISEQEYRDFYRHIAHDFSDPLAYLHAKMEGNYEYTLLLFIPGSAPYDLWIPEARHGVKLHVRRVFITEDTGQLLPAYLRFVRGVIDSSDLPLNISREMLQGSRVVDSIRSSAVKRVLKLLKDMAADEPEKYATFWKEFGAALKEGIPEDFSNRDDIAGLLRFTSTRSETDEADVSFSDYVARMKDGQQDIYYLIAPTLTAARTSPHLEFFRAKGVEVLLLTQPIDNWVVTGLREFDGKKLQSVAQGGTDLSGLENEADKQAQEAEATEAAALLERLKAALGDQVSQVRVSSRLTTSPACIVADEPDLDVFMARRMRGSGLPSQPVLEINPRHPLVERLNQEDDEARFTDWAHVLYSEAVLTLGAAIEDPAAFVNRLNDLLTTLTGAAAAPAPDSPADSPADTSETPSTEA